MELKDWIKWVKEDFIFRIKDFISICKFMYKDKVDMFMHIAIALVFLWGFFSGRTDMMAGVGFFGLYAFTTAVRMAYWKRIVSENIEKFKKEQ